MDTQITATDLAKGLSDVLNRVRYRGERFVVERNGEPVAAVLPVAGIRGLSVSALFERLRRLNWPDEGFADDLEAVQANQPKAGDPEWRS
ncbi:MAG: type II toxin-antitoxin system Phd/YefM family antitoxin [Dehalococcoidia bacterium]|nr:type II toxin-antitoxin system Phd/YefM family antitoxin [Dehalococcoidia bacterium]